MLARFALCLALLLTPIAALAQSWTVTNISNRTLKFDVWDPARGWTVATIYPNQSATYRMNAPMGKFRMGTDGRGFVEYSVRAGGLYTLGWDAYKGVWDLKLAPGASAGGQRPQHFAGGGGGGWGGGRQWELHNRSNQTLRFETLDPSRGTWAVQTLYPNEQRSYGFAPGVRSGRIRVATQGRGFVEYDVSAGWRYSLIWDNNRRMWDFRTVARPS